MENAAKASMPKIPRTSSLGLPVELRLQIYRHLLPSTLYVEPKVVKGNAFPWSENLRYLLSMVAMQQRLHYYYSLQHGYRTVYREFRDLKPCGDMTPVVGLKTKHYFTTKSSYVTRTLPTLDAMANLFPWKDIKVVAHRPSEQDYDVACLWYGVSNLD